MNPLPLAPLLLFALLTQSTPTAATASDPLQGEWHFAYVLEGRSMLEAIGAPDIDALTLGPNGQLRLVNVLGRADVPGTWEATDKKLILRLPIDEKPGVLEYDYKWIEDGAALVLSSLVEPDTSLNGTAAAWAYFRPERFLDSDLTGRWTRHHSESRTMEMLLGQDGQYSGSDGGRGYYRTWATPSGATLLTIVATGEIDHFLAFEFQRDGRHLFLSSLFPAGQEEEEEEEAVKWTLAEDDLDSSLE